MQDYTAMALFVHVVERGGFTAAARYLREPLSTVSRRIAELEQSLGIRLLERSTRTVRLTDLGEIYYEHCRKGLQEFESANLVIQNRQSDVAGLLRMTVPPNLVKPFFIPMITAFQNRYPNARIAVLSTERYVDLLHERIDIAFRIGRLKDSRLMARKLASYTSYLVAAPDYLKQHGPIRNPEDLAEHRTIVFQAGEGQINWDLNATLPGGRTETATVSVMPQLMVNDFSGILAATLTGGGIARIPTILCAAAVHQGRLVRILADWSFEPTTISVVTPGTGNASRLLRLFLDHCAQTLPRTIADAENPFGRPQG
ncbi:MAG: LysR family transcriptional regulator [Roseibium sp.]|nr:LysR family transcriptional regulator [Roseibium sp.]